MFDLEEKISAWRKQMLAAGIKFPVPLEELENHLREDIEQQIQSGLNPQQAFEIAVQKIGHADTLKKEFKKTRETKGAQRTAGRTIRRLGGFGLIVVIYLNVAAVVIFPKSSAFYFSKQWWSDWFPAYSVWIVFMIVGIVRSITDFFANCKSRSNETKE